MSLKTIALIVLGILVLILVVSNIVIVQQSKAYVVERLGAFRAIWNVGLHFKVPFIERVAKRVSLKEQVADFAPQPVITKDNVTMQIDTVIYFQITDPKLYTYGVERPMNAIENLTATTLRNIIGDMELDQSLTSRDTINTRMRAILDEATDPWGIKVNRVELKNIIPPKEIQNAMEKQMKAERVSLCSFEKLDADIAPEDYVVIMTRGHQADYEVLTQTLRSGARYLGCIGSRPKLALCRERLLAAGFTAEEYAAVHAPIGLAIGAQTPEEIAVAVAAELIAVRAGVQPPRGA